MQRPGSQTFMDVSHQEMRPARQGFVATPMPVDFICRVMEAPFSCRFNLKG